MALARIGIASRLPNRRTYRHPPSTPPATSAPSAGTRQVLSPTHIGLDHVRKLMWTRSALESVLVRDPADAFNDALALAAALEARLRRVLDLEEQSNPPPEIEWTER